MAILKVRDNDGNIVEIPAIKGDKGDKGDRGDPGYTPVRGTDYFTEEDIAEVVAQAGGLPHLGTLTGDVDDVTLPQGIYNIFITPSVNGIILGTFINIVGGEGFGCNGLQIAIESYSMGSKMCYRGITEGSFGEWKWVNKPLTFTGAVTGTYDGTSAVTIDIPDDFIDYDANVRSVNHRGYSTVAPENTLPAYILSKKKGFTYVEADVSFTADGVAVLLHDSTIDRTSNGTGSISSMKYTNVCQYDFGSWKSADYAKTRIPTFKEFIKLCKQIVLHPYIELKNNGAYTQTQIQNLVDIVEANGMKGKVTWISFSSTFLEYVKNADPEARLGYLVSSVTDTAISTARGLKTGSNEVFMDSSDYDADAIARCVAADIPLEIWTINDENVIKGMDGYITGVTSDNLRAGKVLYDVGMNTTIEPIMPAEASAVVNIAMGQNGGTNIGTGGSAYNATYSGVTFASDGSGFETNGSGYLTIPTEFMATTDPWTVAFTIEKYTPGTASYSRFARGANDVPSLFYTKTYSATQAKITSSSVNTAQSKLEILNEDNITIASNGGVLISIPTNSATTFVYRNNGEKVSLWINGIEIMRDATTNYTATYQTSTFSIGNNATTASYNMSYLKCSKLMAWDRGLTDEEIRTI